MKESTKHPQKLIKIDYTKVNHEISEYWEEKEDSRSFQRKGKNRPFPKNQLLPKWFWTSQQHY